MKKVYLIPVLIILIISLLISSTYAVKIYGQDVSGTPPYTLNGKNIFCIEKGAPIGSGNVAVGTISSTYQPPVNNAPTYTEVGTYDLPIEIAYALVTTSSVNFIFPDCSASKIRIKVIIFVTLAGFRGSSAFFS